MPRRLTTEEFIEKAKAVHGDRYDYSLVKYIGTSTNVVIVCPDHGPFEQWPQKHLMKRGCHSCAGTKKLTSKQFIEKAKSVHGDCYDYSQTKYVAADKKVTIVCRTHGPFTQTPNSHTSGSGCRLCGVKATQLALRSSTAEFIEKARFRHGDRYDYPSVLYVKARTEVIVICPEHGPFEVTPNNHISKGSGCKACAGVLPLTTDSFTEKAKSLHGGRYDYSMVEYVNARTPVTIICPDHGPFPQAPSDHLYQRSGCRTCAGRVPLNTDIFIGKAEAVHGDRYDYSLVDFVRADEPVTIICPDHGPFQQAPENHLYGRSGCQACAGNLLVTTDDFIRKASAVHGDRYDYSETKYVKATEKVKVICSIHGPFRQIPNNHLWNMGCPDCAETGFNPSEPGLLYYIAIATEEGDTRYKIGITNYTVEQRFRAPDLARIRVVKTWRYAIGRAAAEREAELLRQYAGDKYCGPDILLSGGNTELFTHDVLGLDKGKDRTV